MAEITDVDVIMAIQDDARKYGIDKLAFKLDKKPSTLYAELNPWGEPGKAKLGLLDAFKIMHEAGAYTGLSLLASKAGFRIIKKNPTPDRKTVAEEICQDAVAFGTWSNICDNPDATEAEVRIARQQIAKELDETEALKLEQIRQRKAV